MTDAEANRFVEAHYGAGRENASNDDAVAAERAQALLSEQSSKRE